MTLTLSVIPIMAPLGFGGLLGPIVVLAMASVLVTLGVLVAGLVMEQRDATDVERMGRAADRRPCPAFSLRDAA